MFRIMTWAEKIGMNCRMFSEEEETGFPLTEKGNKVWQGRSFSLGTGIITPWRPRPAVKVSPGSISAGEPATWKSVSISLYY